MTQHNARIVYTKIDEAPFLATYSLLPILKGFTKSSGIDFLSYDISLAGRIIAMFPEELSEEQRLPDYLAMLGELATKPEANIVKLPNISATLPQLKAAIAELQSHGVKVPGYPESPGTEAENIIYERYAKVLGSAVNPVLREGNSDRRAAAAVKEFGKKNPHKMMKDWPEASKTFVASMEKGDFFGSETSCILQDAKTVSIEFASVNGEKLKLKDHLKLQEKEVIDASVLSVKELRSFYAEQIERAKKEDMLLSLHLKATMMKVSDPAMFGHCVEIYYQELFEKYGDLFKELEVNTSNGIADLYSKLEMVDEELKANIEADIADVYSMRPSLAMVDSSKGITNLHLPNNIIIDASVPVIIRDGGRMWGPDDKLHDTLAMIPDRCYATMYQAVVEDCQRNGAFDPAVMGTVGNVGLMAQKAEEYGSHDKTFIAAERGRIQVITDSGEILLEQQVEEGDIFRMCQTKDAPISNWVKLAVTRAAATGSPAVFWLDENRSHDVSLLEKVRKYLPLHNTEGLEIKIMPPVEAMEYTLKRIRQGEDTIAVTGNVLRDYLTDLFPILELGTSAKMLSIVPLMNGGGLFETGAGGSAPKHVQQFLEENHLRWDSLGEFCALVASFEHLANTTGNQRASLLAKTLDEAIGMHLENGRNPSRKVMEMDNRGSHYYLAAYWAKALAKQKDDQELQNIFSEVARGLAEKEDVILKEMNGMQGKPVDIDGYYHADPVLTEEVMRPSATFNAIIDSL